MELLYNRICDINILEHLSNNEKTLFIVSRPIWEKGRKQQERSRGNVCKEKLKPLHLIEIEYQNRGVSSEHTILDGFTVWFNDKEKEEFDSLDVDTMKCFVDKLHQKYSFLIVDITLINIRFLGSFLGILPFYNWESIFFCYTEPGEYIEKPEGDCKSFDMKNSTLGFDEIPNLQTIGDSASDCEWVVFMGFEGERLIQLELEAAPGRRYVVPVMCIPSMHIEWHNYAIESNMEFIENIEQPETIKYVSAINPFEAYNFLVGEKKNTKMRMKISSVGTKPTILGSVMYIVGHSEDMLLTDNPYQEDENSKEYGKSYCYDMSYYINNVTNTRFKEE